MTICPVAVVMGKLGYTASYGDLSCLNSSRSREDIVGRTHTSFTILTFDIKFINRSLHIEALYTKVRSNATYLTWRNVPTALGRIRVIRTREGSLMTGRLIAVNDLRDGSIRSGDRQEGAAQDDHTTPANHELPP